jgi:hypothetical protein
MVPPKSGIVWKLKSGGDYSASGRLAKARSRHQNASSVRLRLSCLDSSCDQNQDKTREVTAILSGVLAITERRVLVATIDIGAADGIAR